MASKRKGKSKRGTNDNDPIVSPFLAQHGDYRQQFMPDPDTENQRRKMVSALVNRASTIVDKWLFEGGPGFEEPQGQAIKHCRDLWRRLGAQPLVANYAGVNAGQGECDLYLAAISQLGSYQREFPPYIWDAFENVVRHDLPAGTAGSRMANNTPQAIAHAKACVGFVASKIAEWRGY